MYDLNKLHGALNAVCPTKGVSVGTWGDRGTWRVDHADGATEDQKAAAMAMLVAFDFSAPTSDHVNAERDRRMSQFPFGGMVYQFDNDSQANIAGVGTLALAAIINGSQPGDYRWSDVDADFYWLAADNTQTVLDAQMMFAFAQAAAAWKRDHIYAARGIKNLTPIPADYAADSRWPTA